MIEIRKVEELEAQVLRELAERTFVHTFAQYNTPENMNAYISSAFSMDQLTEELNSPQRETHFALSEGKPVGYLQLNFDSSESGLENLNVIELARLYVLPEVFGQKVGKELMERAIFIAEQREVEYIWLGVWEHNYRARSFYARWGFEEFGSHVFQLGDDAQKDLLLKKSISSKRKKT